MSDDDARIRRAAELRRQIAGLTGGGAGATPEAPDRRRPPRVQPQSPRDFIGKRMREIDRPGKPARDEEDTSG